MSYSQTTDHYLLPVFLPLSGEQLTDISSLYSFTVCCARANNDITDDYIKRIEKVALAARAVLAVAEQVFCCPVSAEDYVVTVAKGFGFGLFAVGGVDYHLVYAVADAVEAL